MGGLVAWLPVRPWLEPVGRLLMRAAAALALIVLVQVLVVRYLAPVLPGATTVLLVAAAALLLRLRRPRRRSTWPPPALVPEATTEGWGAEGTRRTEGAGRCGQEGRDSPFLRSDRPRLSGITVSGALDFTRLPGGVVAQATLCVLRRISRGPED